MNEPTLSPPSKPYEPYPGCSLRDFAHDFLNSKPVTLQAFCMNERIDPYDLTRLVSEVLVDWELTEPAHSTRREAMSHLVNHLRIKIRNEQRNNSTRQRGRTSGADADPASRMARIAEEILRQSSRDD